MNIEIKSGRIVDPVNGIDEVQSLYVVDGKVASIGHAPEGFLGMKLEASPDAILSGSADSKVMCELKDHDVFMS